MSRSEDRLCTLIWESLRYRGVRPPHHRVAEVSEHEAAGVGVLAGPASWRQCWGPAPASRLCPAQRCHRLPAACRNPRAGAAVRPPRVARRASSRRPPHHIRGRNPARSPRTHGPGSRGPLACGHRTEGIGQTVGKRPLRRLSARCCSGFIGIESFPHAEPWGQAWAAHITETARQDCLHHRLGTAPQLAGS